MASPNGKVKKCLTLSEKIDALKHLETKPVKEVMVIMGVGRTQLHELKKRKAEVLESYNAYSNPNAEIMSHHWIRAGEQISMGMVPGRHSEKLCLVLTTDSRESSRVC